MYVWIRSSAKCCKRKISLPQNAGLLWPTEWVKSRAASRSTPLDTRLGNVSLIPLRGSENEMRNSVAAFTADHLYVSFISQSIQPLDNHTANASHIRQQTCLGWLTPFRVAGENFIFSWAIPFKTAVSPPTHCVRSVSVLTVRWVLLLPMNRARHYYSVRLLPIFTPWLCDYPWAFTLVIHCKSTSLAALCALLSVYYRQICRSCQWSIVVLLICLN